MIQCIPVTLPTDVPLWPCQTHTPRCAMSTGATPHSSLRDEIQSTGLQPGYKSALLRIAGLHRAAFQHGNGSTEHRGNLDLCQAVLQLSVGRCRQGRLWAQGISHMAGEKLSKQSDYEGSGIACACWGRFESAMAAFDILDARQPQAPVQGGEAAGTSSCSKCWVCCLRAWWYSSRAWRKAHHMRSQGCIRQPFSIRPASLRPGSHTPAGSAVRTPGS